MEWFFSIPRYFTSLNTEVNWEGEESEGGRERERKRESESEREGKIQKEKEGGAYMLNRKRYLASSWSP